MKDYLKRRLLTEAHDTYVEELVERFRKSFLFDSGDRLFQEDRDRPEVWRLTAELILSLAAEIRSGLLVPDKPLATENGGADHRTPSLEHEDAPLPPSLGELLTELRGGRHDGLKLVIRILPRLVGGGVLTISPATAGSPRPGSEAFVLVKPSRWLLSLLLEYLRGGSRRAQVEAQGAGKGPRAGDKAGQGEQGEQGRGPEREHPPWAGPITRSPLPLEASSAFLR